MISSHFPGSIPSLRFATGRTMSSVLWSQNRYIKINEIKATNKSANPWSSTPFEFCCPGEACGGRGRRAQHWRRWVPHSSNGASEDQGGHCQVVQPLPHQGQELHSNPSQQGGLDKVGGTTWNNCITGSSQESRHHTSPPHHEATAKVRTTIAMLDEIP